MSDCNHCIGASERVYRVIQRATIVFSRVRMGNVGNFRVTIDFLGFEICDARFTRSICVGDTISNQRARSIFSTIIFNFNHVRIFSSRYVRYLISDCITMRRDIIRNLHGIGNAISRFGSHQGATIFFCSLRVSYQRDTDPTIIMEAMDSLGIGVIAMSNIFNNWCRTGMIGSSFNDLHVRVLENVYYRIISTSSISMGDTMSD